MTKHRLALSSFTSSICFSCQSEAVFIYTYLIYNLTSATWNSEEITSARPENTGNSGNQEAECIIDFVAFFSTEKEKVVNTTGSKINSDRQHAGKKEGFLSKI